MFGIERYMKLDRDLREVVRLIDDVGWSRHSLRGANGSVSLTAALGMIFAVPESAVSDDFYDMVEFVPNRLFAQFCVLWDLLERELGDLATANAYWASQEECTQALMTIWLSIHSG